MKRVAVITPSKFPGTDGSTANFSEMISQLIKEGFKILLICPKNTDVHSKNVPEASSFQMVRIPFAPPRLAQMKGGINLAHYFKLFIFLIAEWLTVLREINRKKFTYVFLRHGILTIQLPLLLKLIGIKIIADGELLSGSGLGKIDDSVFSKLLHFYERRVVNTYTYFKVTTQAQAENMEKWGFPRERILNVPVSIDIDKVPRSLLEEIPEHTFGYFGVLEQWQGVDILLKAFQIVHKRIPTAKLYVIGEGSLKDKLKMIVSQNNLSYNVIFVNAISREELWHDYFKRFRIVIIPRPKQNDCIDTIMPIKLIESLAAGKPIIAIDISVMKEIPRNPIFLIPSADPMSLADAMEVLSNNKRKQEEYSARAIVSAANYDIKSNVKKIVAVLTKVNNPV